MTRAVLTFFFVLLFATTGLAKAPPHYMGKQIAAGEGWAAYHTVRSSKQEMECLSSQVSFVVEGDEFTEVPLDAAHINLVKTVILPAWLQDCEARLSLHVETYVRGVYINGNYTEYFVGDTPPFNERPLHIVTYDHRTREIRSRGEENLSVAQTVGLYTGRQTAREARQRARNYRPSTVDCGPTMHPYPGSLAAYVAADPSERRKARAIWLDAASLFSDRRFNRVMFCEYQFLEPWQGPEPQTYLDIVRGYKLDPNDSTGVQSGPQNEVSRLDYYWLVASLSVATTRVCNGKIPGGSIPGELVRSLVNAETDEVLREITETLRVPTRLYVDVGPGIAAFQALGNDPLFSRDLLYAPITRDLSEMIRRTGCQSEQLAQYIRNLALWPVGRTPR